MFTRTLKRLIAKIGIAAMLFTQLAVGAYACPTLTGIDDTMSAAMAEGADTAMSGSEKKLDTDTPNLCLQHCQAGSQSVETTPHVSVPAIATMVIAIVEPISLIANLGITDTSVVQKRQTSPPPLIRFGVLRI